MTVTITLEQNSAENLKLLAAQRHLYTRAKMLRRSNVLVAISLAVMGPVVALIWPEAGKVVGVIGVFWSAGTLLLESAESRKKAQAALVQEELDTGLFKLPWNGSVVGDRLSPELIYSANRKFKDQRARLRDWYGDLSGVPYPLDVLLCQRSNVVWDWRLRRHYAAAISVLCSVLAIAGVALAIGLQMTVWEYLQGVLAPTLPALLLGGMLAKQHRQTASEKESIEREIARAWEAGLDDPRAVSTAKCRSFQDRIYRLRKEGPLVPDMWYVWLRDRYQVDMDSAIEALKREVRSRITPQSSQTTN